MIWAIKITSNTNHLIPEFKPGSYLRAVPSEWLDRDVFEPAEAHRASFYSDLEGARAAWDQAYIKGVTVDFVQFVAKGSVK